MDLSGFNHNYLSPLVEKLSYENKSIVLFGDFNADLLKYDSDTDTSNFLDLMFSNALLPLISSPTQVNPTSQTLNDNIFTNDYDLPHLAGNIVTTLSDHQAQFVLLTKYSKSKQKKHFISGTLLKWKNKKDLINTQLTNTNWVEVLCIEQNNVNKSTNILLNKIQKLIEFWALLQKMLNSKKKTLNKPWITKGILKSISIKNNLF